MRNILKKGMVTTMTIALPMGGVIASSQNAQAAAKLRKADFKFTGKYKSNMNTIITLSSDWGFQCVNTIDEKQPKKCIKTKRGIILNSTKKKVLSKYGKTSVKKLSKKTTFYKAYKKDVGGAGFKLIKENKCAVYKFKSGSNKYQLYFFFDKKNKVNAIVASKNC